MYIQIELFIEENNYLFVESSLLFGGKIWTLDFLSIEEIGQELGGN